MTAMPADLAYGKVVGRFILAVADAGDADRLPDPKPAVGTITLTPKAPLKKVSTGEPTTVIRQIITCTLDDEGRLADPQGETGVWLVAGVYTVAYKINSVSIASHDIEVLAEHGDATPLNLTNAIPPGSGVLTPTQFAELSARIDAVDTGVRIALDTDGTPYIY